MKKGTKEPNEGEKMINRRHPKIVPNNSARNTFGVSYCMDNNFTYRKERASAIPSIAKLIKKFPLKYLV